MQGDASLLRHVLRPGIKNSPRFVRFVAVLAFQIVIDLHSIYLNFVISINSENSPYVTLERQQKM